MNKTIMGFAATIALLFLYACSPTNEERGITDEKEEVNKESLILSFKNPQTNQEFKIVKAYKLFEGLREKTEESSERSKLDVYKEVVIDPIYQDCFANAEYPNMADSILHSAPDLFTPLTILGEKIEEKQVEKAIQQALIKSSNILPSSKETTVCLFTTTNSNTSPMFTVGAGKIIILYNYYFDNNFIKAGTAHEYHHSVWTERYLNNDKPFTVLDNIIFEGKAVTFEKLIYPEVELTRINESYDKENWEKIKNNLHTVNLNRALEIIRGENGLPLGYGYSEGYKMVQSYLDLHPELSPEEWTPIEAREIFDDGNYIDNYQ
ncbi:DUF2268 domain-containing putative Zn-dependent protease [Cytobacillus sp. IB215665]|uniref:DUF2268 domain-containing putative Zn-dependent protease n=1 Tax=Cytobacillus sp. IB215665 TaxID=3097357 RepID=UPI002A0AEC11|nr:DUF2268 domain-containing putative Zn-dependent protease [Cytobacillus sp. IB215665]MDX8365681.1 DUF2268 domain-containing putative Zn-dependent protease [Cytobacillus sp. IB215665]